MEGRGGGGKQGMSLGMPREELALWVPSFSRAAGDKQARRADGMEGLLHVFFSSYWTIGHVQIRFVNRCDSGDSCQFRVEK